MTPRLPRVAALCALPVLAVGCASSDYSFRAAPLDADQDAAEAPPEPIGSERFSMSGSIVDLANGRSVDGAQVCVLRGLEATHCVRTGDDGAWQLYPEAPVERGAGPRVVSIEVTAPGYSPTVLTRNAHRSVEDLEIALPSTLLRRLQEARVGVGSVEGTGHVVVRVEDLSGAPRPDVIVAPWSRAGAVYYTDDTGLFGPEARATGAEVAVAGIANAKAGTAWFALAAADGTALHCGAIDGVDVHDSGIAVTVVPDAVTFARVRCWSDGEAFHPIGEVEEV